MASRGARFELAPSRGRARVGLSIMHGPGDSGAAVEQINTEVISMAKAVIAAAGGDPGLVDSDNLQATFHDWEAKRTAALHALSKSDLLSDLQAIAHGQASGLPTAGDDPGVKWAKRVIESRDAINRSPLASFWDGVVSPFVDEWQSFYRSHSHWYDQASQFLTNWEVYQHWLDRCAQMRELIEAHGIRLGPKPTPLDRSAIEGIGDVLKKTSDTILSVAKAALWGGLALGGTFAAVKIYESAKTAGRKSKR